MLDPSFETARAKILELNGRYISGKEDAFDATRDLLNYLLTLTVVKTGQSLRFMRNVEAQRQSRVIGDIQRGPLALNDGRYLRIWVSLKLEYDKAFGRNKLRVYNASYQYQEHPTSDEWIIRYDYTRLPPDHHPPSHVQVNGDLRHPGCLPADTPFCRLHLPAGRVSIEAVIRMLADQFKVPCNTEPAFWRPLLAESESAFNEIAHKPLSGPPHELIQKSKL